jgi:ATP-dependent helicase/nuclease subunit B
MSVQFILGRSGTGKTRRCIEAIVDALSDASDDRQLILLVPEQATYQAERAILSGGKVPGYHRLHVLSFDRLVYLLLGRRTARPAVSQIGRNMIIQRILLENQDKLRVLGGAPSGPGIARRMAQTIAELQQHGRTPEDIEQSQERLKKNGADDLTIEKFRDIALVYEKYLKFIEGKLFDPDMQLMHACRQAAKSDFIKGAKLWVDGFAGFTGAELEMLTELVRTADETQIALCLDPSSVDLTNPDKENIDPADLFYPTVATYAEIVAQIKKAKLRIEKPLILEKPLRFDSCPPLAHIERNIFQTASARIAACENIRIVSAPNTRAEAHFVVTEILKLVAGHRYRYRDIAVVASDIEQYEHYIRGYFQDYDIPVFIDKRKRLNQHPLVELICSALKAATGDLSNSDIFACLKTDLTPIGRNDVDLLENYCIAFGIRPDDWTSKSPWRFAGERDKQFDEKRVNEIRRRVIEPLLELKSRLIPQGDAENTVTAEEFTKAVFDFLDRHDVRERMQQWIEQAEQQKDYAAADEHRQLYDRLVDVFDEIVDVFVDWPMKSEDYLAVLISGFAEIALAFIPPNLDQVLVGSIERSRHPDLKAVFLVGATQKQFPVPIFSAGILTEDDRTAAESANLTLAPSTRQELASRQYLAYIAFTRPSQYLCVTYPAVDEAGSAIVCSQFVDNLQSLFEGLAEQSVVTEQFGADEIRGKYDLEDFLCCRLGKDSPPLLSCGSKTRGQQQDAESLQLLQDVCHDEKLSAMGARALTAIEYENKAQLAKKTVNEIFTGQIRSSASRLSTYAACPYRYFARYVLELRKREEFKLEPLDVGNFYHGVLDRLTKRINREKKDFATIKDEQLLRMVREEIAGYCQQDSFISNFSAHGEHNRFIIGCASEYLEDCVLALVQMIRAGIFRPVLSEVAFGTVEDSKTSIGELEIALGDGRQLFLNGKIDRLDVAEIKGKKIAIVFDYKRKGQSFNWSHFHHGLDIQLPVYMLAVRNAGGAKKFADDIAGAFYIPVEVGTEPIALSKLNEGAKEFYHKAMGIFDGGFFKEMDSSAASGWSKFYNFAVTSNHGQYGYYSSSGAIKPDDFQNILKFGENKIAEIARQIVSGRIDVRPYRLSGKSPCAYCEYKPLCRFDWQINDYNHLANLGKADVLNRTENRDGREKN